jgi:hypothetical protein
MVGPRVRAVHAQSSAQSVGSIRLAWSRQVIESGDIMTFLFGDREETKLAAGRLVNEMKQDKNLSITLRRMRKFAEELDSGDSVVKYSYHNFYTKLVRKLIRLGFIEKEMLWSPEKGTTVRVYRLRIQQIPKHPPESGFIRQAWYVSKAWNDLVSNNRP